MGYGFVRRRDVRAIPSMICGRRSIARVGLVYKGQTSRLIFRLVPRADSARPKSISLASGARINPAVDPVACREPRAMPGPGACPRLTSCAFRLAMDQDQGPAGREPASPPTGRPKVISSAISGCVLAPPLAPSLHRLGVSVTLTVACTLSPAPVPASTGPGSVLWDSVTAAPPLVPGIHAAPTPVLWPRLPRFRQRPPPWPWSVAQLALSQ